MKYLLGFVVSYLCLFNTADAQIIEDAARQRQIPVEIAAPTHQAACTAKQPCPVAFVSAGYGMGHSQYRFATDALNQLGYLTVAIAHELPQDPPLSVSGNLYQTRSENWRRGAATLAFMRAALQEQYPNYDFDSLLLFGHSNGGDISAWLANEGQPYIKTVITLDNRRVPLPRSETIGVLSIRGSDFPADAGVLPTTAEQTRFGSCVVQIPAARHNDMADSGPPQLRRSMAMLITAYLGGATCSALRQQLH
ncbi:alpha/beta hydrolase [Shewanella sp. C32]|uniref:Alpha/beta hydrolase n=1 Tax=Shewanella electrica TaxID=515560 RepID=A0ABT2FH45_9GAMM|nr:alpha/beta hydrolase [Shewanella electrica]MCH1923563.1 alpha/beta hydrolase [Shewanella electrica]MCS4555659.1 alpha/beta hydrolase [Shewanella electrica]